MNRDINIFNEQEFRSRISKIINELNYSEAELAEKLGVSQGTINRWKNKKLLPKVDLLVKLSVISNLTLEYIILGKK